MSQPPRKAPSQPGLKQNNQGHAKKARPHRSNSQSKPPSVKATDGYAMGSYDNEVVNEPTSTPSWMRDTPSEPTMAKVPSSPSFPTSPSPSIPTSNNHLVAPIPFHLPTFGSTASTTPMQTFAPNFNAPAFSLLPPTGFTLPPAGSTLPTPTSSTGATGLVPLANGFNGTFLAPPASAPPSTHPLPTQDAIARILALQQANAHMSTSTTPLVYPTMQEGYNQNSVNFSRNFTEDARTCQPATPALLAPSNPAATPLSNPFASAPSTLQSGAVTSQTSATQLLQPNQSSAAMSPFQFPTQATTTTTVPAPAVTSQTNGSTPVSLDHLMSLQHQTNAQMRQPLRLSSGVAHPLPGDSIWQLQSPAQASSGPMMAGGLGGATVNGTKSPLLAVSNNPIHANGHVTHHPTDILFEPSPATRLPLKSSSKHLATRSGAPIHAHHNYGVPAQP